MGDQPQLPLPSIEHAGSLKDLRKTPKCLLPDPGKPSRRRAYYSCSFCGVGDSGVLPTPGTTTTASQLEKLPNGKGRLKVKVDGKSKFFPALLEGKGQLTVETTNELTSPGGVLNGELSIQRRMIPVTARETDRAVDDDGVLVSQTFVMYRRMLAIKDSIIQETKPTSGCAKLKLSLLRQRPAFAIHTAPSVLLDGRSGEKGGRKSIPYEEAIDRFSELLLQHRREQGKTLVYACGQVDYFTIFAVQEVFRLLGVRNLTGNAEHCLNAGAVHNEVLTGQEGPFLNIAQSIKGRRRFFLFNGWNGFITHPPVFRAIMQREELDAYLVEVMVTESAKVLAQRLGPERILLIRPGSDPHFALAIAHEILEKLPHSVEERFIEHFADGETFERFRDLALSPTYEPQRVAERIAPEPQYVEPLLKGIRRIARKLARPDTVPINIPSVGLSQTTGVVGHCLWGDILAMIGKYGLSPNGSPMGGTLRLPGQINAETEVQGLSRKYFMGRVPIDQAAEAARRMDLPEDAYDPVLEDEPRAALDYSDPTPDTPELFVFIGTQFEANMMNRERWVHKLRDPGTKFIVIDPIPDPFTLDNADLIIPSPPHPAVPKLYQNGEWKLSLSIPTKVAPEQTRSDAAILYDVMARIGDRIAQDEALAAEHPDLQGHVESGYVDQRFGEGLDRYDGEVSRAQLWDRVQDYLGGGSGPLYCRPETEEGEPITWKDLFREGSLVYGGVGTTRYVLDYEQPDKIPFGDIYRNPRRFTFFVPKARDLHIPQGVILNSGRSSLLDEGKRIRFATSTFNSGKATPNVGMPEDNPLHMSPHLAQLHGIKTGDQVRITNRFNGQSLVLPAIVSNRVKGETVYVSFHKSHAQIERGQYLNAVTSHEGRCPYTSQTNLKATQILVERVVKSDEAPRSFAKAGLMKAYQLMRPTDLPIDTTLIDPKADLPVWTGQNTSLYVTDVIEETDDVYTFRFQGDPLCKFVYWPGQFGSIVLNIDGKKVVRSYTISSPPTRPFVLEMTIKRVPGGLVSNWLPDNLKIGDRIEISGPKGKFCLVPGKIPRKLLFIGAGSGITPLMSMARWLFDVSANVDVKFFYSARSSKDLIFGQEIELLTTRYKMFSPILITTTREKEEGWEGLKGRINQSMIERIAPDLNERHVYMCGPLGFMDAVRDILRGMGFDLANLHSESFGGVRTSVAEKALPLTGDGAVDEVVEEAAAGSIRVEFARSGKTAKTDGRMSLLDLAEMHDIDLDYGCRTGSCGDCQCRLLKGEVEMSTDEGLMPGEKSVGYILTCVAHPRGDVVLDA